MPQPMPYFSRFQAVRGSWTGLPPWARGVVGIFALPGILLILLSLLLLVVSILGLLLLTVPVYRLLQAVTGGMSSRTVAEGSTDGSVEIEPPMPPSPLEAILGFGPAAAAGGRRRVAAKVTDASDTTVKTGGNAGSTVVDPPE